MKESHEIVDAALAEWAADAARVRKAMIVAVDNALAEQRAFLIAAFVDSLNEAGFEAEVRNMTGELALPEALGITIRKRP